MGVKVSIFGEELSAELEKAIITIISRTLESNNLISSEFAIDINFVTAEKIRQLNADFRKKNYATDVLSFGQFEDILNGIPKGIMSPIMLGDLVFCREIIEKEAGEENKSYEDQLKMLAEHGTLHLIGIHHLEN
jgi:probable rRNA maturation factor